MVQTIAKAVKKVITNVKSLVNQGLNDLSEEIGFDSLSREDQRSTLTAIHETLENWALANFTPDRKTMEIAVKKGMPLAFQTGNILTGVGNKRKYSLLGALLVASNADSEVVDSYENVGSLGTDGIGCILLGFPTLRYEDILIISALAEAQAWTELSIALDEFGLYKELAPYAIGFVTPQQPEVAVVVEHDGLKVSVKLLPVDEAMSHIEKMAGIKGKEKEAAPSQPTANRGATATGVPALATITLTKGDNPRINGLDIPGIKEDDALFQAIQTLGNASNDKVMKVRIDTVFIEVPGVKATYNQLHAYNDGTNITLSTEGYEDIVIPVVLFQSHGVSLGRGKSTLYLSLI